MTKQDKIETQQEEKTELRGHIFDGIQEYDNDLPKWWVRLFYATIVFSVPYFLWYHSPFFPSKGLVEEYAIESGEAAKEIEAENAKPKIAVDYSSPELIAKGKITFATNCLPCHGAEGQGVIGPNLTDDAWIHGNKTTDVENIINAGIAAKGMPAWESILGKAKVVELVAFIKSLQGTSPANAKAPQGTPGKLE